MDPNNKLVEEIIILSKNYASELVRMTKNFVDIDPITVLTLEDLAVLLLAL